VSEALPPQEIHPTIPNLIRSAADRFGARTFIVADDDALSYIEAELRSRHLAAELLRLGVSKGARVGIYMPNSTLWAIAWFAAARVGAIVVPINTFYRSAELHWALRHADVSVLLMQDSFASIDCVKRLEAAIPDLCREGGREPLCIPCVPYLRTIVAWGSEERPWMTRCVLPSASEDRGGYDHALLLEVERCVTPADILVLMYTSGSTGEPKGVLHSHGTLVRHSLDLTHLYVTHNDDVVFNAMPFFWVGGLITGLHAVVHHGAKLVTQAVFDAEGALTLMERHRATIALGWPQHGSTISEHPKFNAADISSIRRTSMPSIVPPDKRPPEVHSESLGMTELCGNHLGIDPYQPLPVWRRGTFGPSIKGLKHRVVDSVSGIDCRVGREGEIWVRGPCLMQGLYKREREDTFTPDGYYRTGDTGWMDSDGWITFTGRMGEMIKTAGGTNVTPSEVEAALLACSGVLEAYVTGVVDQSGGEVVAAAVVPMSGLHLEAEALRGELRLKLSAYKVPKRIWIVDKDNLPFSASGKLIKRELSAMMSIPTQGGLVT
jgi:acyl-CoA synthetase (AMP-forming)/AMP-acid ligase II